MKVMHSKVSKYLMATVASTALLGVAVAQQQDFPREREQAKSCAQVDWNKDMTTNHPRLTEACREVVTVDGKDWARFEAKFARIEPDGRVSFSIRDSRDRSIEESQPAAGHGPGRLHRQSGDTVLAAASRPASQPVCPRRPVWLRDPAWGAT
jgi:hypothetical protein